MANNIYGHDLQVVKIMLKFLIVAKYIWAFIQVARKVPFSITVKYYTASNSAIGGNCYCYSQFVKIEQSMVSFELQFFRTIRLHTGTWTTWMCPQINIHIWIITFWLSEYSGAFAQNSNFFKYFVKKLNLLLKSVVELLL